MPEKFTFPFSYVPHELSRIAVSELQEKIKKENGWNHNFGFDSGENRIGKMFGILVVRFDSEIGYLAAFSGKLADKNIYDFFVPPIYDRLVDGSFYKIGEEELIGINKHVLALENNTELAAAKELYRKIELVLTSDLETQRKAIKVSKKKRKAIREEQGDSISKELTEELKNQSSFERQVYKRLKKRVEADLEAQAKAVAVFEDKIKELKSTRRKKSGALQQRLFDQYDFLNARGESKNVCEIFKEIDIVPPAGAGDCAAPKLLQYAFENGLKPIALAEFWWGGASDKEVRKHGQFYPSCRRKCEPILGHMLKGLEVDENPIILRNTTKLEIKTVFEDDHLLVISKPAGLLSAPGKREKDSVQTRMKEKPLRVDFDNRPQQMVCYEYGKKAKTKWELVEVKNQKSVVHFFPLTGRTHQLRVHASHPAGLNTAILGDVLYGTPENRLHLHAEWISFVHPVSKKVMALELKSEFS